MKTVHKMALFAVLALVQLAVPGWMIWRWETVLREGQTYKFRTAPVDPYDAFRGRYVALRLERETVPNPTGKILEPGHPLFVTLSRDENGFAGFEKAVLEPPADGDYIEARALYSSTNEISLYLPMTRYYLNEKAAPEAERAYAQFSNRTNHHAFIQVRILKGKAVVEDLYLDDVPVRKFLEEKD